MTESLPTVGQLERQLSQQIQALYRSQLGHRPGKVTCHIFDEKIAILLEESVTKPEQLLSDAGQEALAEQVRFDLDNALRPQLMELIEETVGAAVMDLLSDAKLETGRTGMIAVLSMAPQVRDSASIAKIKKQRAAESSSAEV